MSEVGHLTVEERGTQWEGEYVRRGRPGTIPILSMEHQVTHDVRSSWPLQTPRHGRYVIMTILDASGPFFFRAITHAAELRVTARYYAPSESGDGTSTNFYTVVLDRAQVVSAEVHVHDDTAPVTLEVAFAYERIEWTWVDGGIQTMDELPRRGES